MNSSTRRFRPEVLIVALVIGATFAVSTGPASASAKSSDSAPTLKDPSATGRKLGTGWLTTLQKGDRTKIAQWLAPNFLIQRADGTSADRKQYIANPATVGEFELGDIVIGKQHGNTLSVLWSVKVNEIIDGQTLSTNEAARITAYVWNGKRWQILAHGNFNVAT